MAYWENPRRRSRRRPRRHNPDGGDGMGASNPGFTSDFTELAKTGLLTTVGFGLAMAVGKVMPNEVKSNIYLSPISKGVAALALLSMKGSIPGGGAVAEQVAAGMATAGVVEAAIKIGGASFPGAAYLPTLPNMGGGGRPRLPAGGLRVLPPPPQATGAPLFKSAAYSPDVVL